MGVLTSLHEGRSYSGPSYSLKDPALAKIFGTGMSTTSGIVVTDELAMTCSAVFCAVNVLSSDVAKPPLNLHKRRANGRGSDLYTDSKTYHLIKTEPNPEMGSMVFRQTLTAHALTLGGGYAEIERNSLGQPVALWPLTPNRVHADRTKAGKLVYIVDSRQEYQPSQIFHLHGLGWDGNSGYSILHYARQVVGLALAAEQFSSAYFKNNAAFGGVIGFDGPKDEEELKEYRQKINESHGGSDKAWRLLLLDQGAKFQSFQGATNSESQMDELRDKQVEEVSRFFRIPVHKLNDLRRATFSNVEQQDLEYYKGPILDWFTLWEQECNRKLIAVTERRIQFFKHNANMFLRGDISSRYTALGIARDKGIINANDWRELEDMNPQDGTQGDEYLVQSAQIPADKLARLAEAQIKKTEQEAKPPEPAPTTPQPTPNDAEKGRAERAEALLAEVRQQLEAQVVARATAEGAASELRQRVEQLIDAEIAAVGRVTVVEAHLQQIGLDRSADNASLSDARTALAETSAKLDAALQELVTRDADVSEANRLEAEARELLHNLTVVETQVRSERDALAVDKLALAATVEEQRTALDAKQAELRALAEKVETAEAMVSAAQTDVTTARADATAARQLADEATDAANAATTDKAAAEATAAEARAMAAEAQTRLSEADRALGEAKASLAAAESRVADAQAETERAKVAAVETRSTRNTEHDGRTIAAHRDLCLMTVRDAIYVECERARRAQQTPKKLQHWIDTWYDGHIERMYERLRPVVSVHLAWLGDDADPGDLTRSLVMEHVAKSRQQLAGISDLEGDELAAVLAGLLRRWETERINEIPDRLMEREVAHVRTNQ